MDDLNIYDDLEEFDSTEKLKLKVEECNILYEKYRSALKQIEELQLDRQSLQKKIENIEKSFSSLLTTARTEITRKTAQITELRKELDDVCFRRGARGRPMETRKPQNASEKRREPHNPHHGYEREPNPCDRSSSHSKNREEKTVRSHKSSERDHSRSRNPFMESEYRSSANYNISSRCNSSKDESAKSSHSTSKYNDTRHRDHISIRKEERSNDRRKEEKSIDHRKQEKSSSHRNEEKSSKYRKEEKLNVQNDSRNTCSKSLDKVKNASAEKSKREKNAVSKSTEKHSLNKIKTKLCSQNETDSICNSLPELDVRQAIVGSSQKKKVNNTPFESAAEIKYPKVERRISLSAYRDRMNRKRSESEDNVNTLEEPLANNVGSTANSSVTSIQVEEIINTNEIQLNENKLKQMPSAEKDTNNVEITLVQNKKDSSLSGKREIAPHKRTFEDVLFDELVYEEDQNKDKSESHESEEESLYAGLEMKDVSKDFNKSDEAIENSKCCESGGTQNKIEVPANDHEDKVQNSKAEDNKIADTSKSKIYFNSLNLEHVKEAESTKEEQNIHIMMNSQQEKIADKQSSRDFLSVVILPEQDNLKTSRNDKNSGILPHDKESEQELNSTNKAEENLSSSNIFDASFEPECNKPASCISPYFGDQKTPIKITNKSQLPKEHNNSIENEMAVMFKESPDPLSVLPPMYQTLPSLKADAVPESKFQNKAKEMFDLYLASPTNVIPSEIENSKDRSPPNPTITGMKKRKSSTPRKSPGLLNGRGLKLVGHRIEGFEPGIRGEKALEASKLKNALFKEILGNETTSEDAAFRKNLHESNEEKDFQLIGEDVLETQEENISQIEEGSSKAINNDEEKIENLSENKKGVRFDVSTQLSNENEKSAGDKVLKVLECFENISDDDDLFSDNSSDLNGKQSTNNSASEEHRGRQEKAENARYNDINTSNNKLANSVENVKREESKDLDDEEIPATDESQQKMPPKVENKTFTELTIEEENEEAVSNPSEVVSDYTNRTNRAPFCSDKICVVIPLSTQDSIKSKENDFKKSPTTYSPEIKIAEKKLHSLKSEIKEDIQEDEVNIKNKNLIPGDSSNQDTSEPNSKVKQIKMKKYVEDFCKTIESVEEETVSDSIRSQASDQGTASSMRKRQSIVTFADLLKLPDKAKETNHSDSSKTIKTQYRTKLNLKNKRTKISTESHIKSKGYKTEGFELKASEDSTKNKQKISLQSSDFKKTTRQSKKVKGVFVRSLYVNSAQEKDIKLLKTVSSTEKEVSVSKLLLKSENYQSTQNAFKKDYSSECVMNTPIKPEPVIKNSPPEDGGKKYSSLKPKMPLIRTISQKRKGSVVSPKKKRRKIEIVYSKEDEPFLEQKVADASTAVEMIKIDRTIETGESSNCAALTNENIRKMLASLDQANATDLKDSEGGEWCKENSKSDETAELSTENKIKNPPKEPSSVEMDAPTVSSDSSVSSEKYNLFEIPVSTGEKIDEQNHTKGSKKTKETLIELFEESPMPTPRPTPMLTPISTPMPTPKRRSSDNDEVQCTFEQLNAINNNNHHQIIELQKDKEFKQQDENSVQNKELVEKSIEFEEQTAEISSDKSKTKKNTSFVGQEKDSHRNSESFDISKIKEPLPVKCAESSKLVVEREKQKSIQPRVEEDKENLSGSKRKISCLSDESKIESLNKSGADITNISTSSADYRIEAVSSDVVNVFITRKKRKKKLK